MRYYASKVLAPDPIEYRSVAGVATKKNLTRVHAPLLAACVSLLGFLCSCAHTTPSLWANDPIPEYHRPAEPEIDPRPTTDVDAPTEVDPGQTCVDGGILIPSDSFVYRGHLIGEALPACEVATEEMTSTIAKDRQMCDRALEIARWESDRERVENIGLRIAVVAAICAAAASFAAGVQLGTEIP